MKGFPFDQLSRTWPKNSSDSASRNPGSVCSASAQSFSESRAGWRGALHALTGAGATQDRHEFPWLQAAARRASLRSENHPTAQVYQLILSRNSLNPQAAAERALPEQHCTFGKLGPGGPARPRWARHGDTLLSLRGLTQIASKRNCLTRTLSNITTDIQYACHLKITC